MIPERQSTELLRLLNGFQQVGRNRLDPAGHPGEGANNGSQGIDIPSQTDGAGYRM